MPKIFNTKLPQRMKKWLINVSVPLGMSAWRQCKPIYTCTALESLELSIDGSFGDWFQHEASIKALLAYLPNKCKVTITNSRPGGYWHGRASSFRKIQKLFDDRKVPETATHKPAPKRKRNHQSIETSPAGPYQVDVSVKISDHAGTKSEASRKRIKTGEAVPSIFGNPNDIDRAEESECSISELDDADFPEFHEVSKDSHEDTSREEYVGEGYEDKGDIGGGVLDEKTDVGAVNVRDQSLAINPAFGALQACLSANRYLCSSSCLVM